MPRYSHSSKGAAGSRRMGSAIFGSGVRRLVPTQHALLKTGLGKSKSHVVVSKKKGRPRYSRVLH